jgi:hypothetical protein
VDEGGHFAVHPRQVVRLAGHCRDSTSGLLGVQQTKRSVEAGPRQREEGSNTSSSSNEHTQEATKLCPSFVQSIPHTMHQTFITRQPHVCAPASMWCLVVR